MAEFLPYKSGICISGVIYMSNYSKKIIVAFHVKRNIKLWNAALDHLRYNYDVRKNSWRKLEILMHSVKGWIDNYGIYTYVESLFPLKKVSNARLQI